MADKDKEGKAFAIAALSLMVGDRVQVVIFLYVGTIKPHLINRRFL